MSSFWPEKKKFKLDIQNKITNINCIKKLARTLATLQLNKKHQTWKCCNLVKQHRAFVYYRQNLKINMTNANYGFLHLTRSTLGQTVCPAVVSSLRRTISRMRRTMSVTDRYFKACLASIIDILYTLDSASNYSAIQKLKPWLQTQDIPVTWEDSYVFYFLNSDKLNLFQIHFQTIQMMKVTDVVF
jgi:hypothetical protein